MLFHTSRKRKGFDRYTFADMQTTRCSLITELGAEVDRSGNAGPHLYDYTVYREPTVMEDPLLIGTDEPLRQEEVEGLSDDPVTQSSREYTFDLIDGIAMGVNAAADYPTSGGMGDINFSNSNWQGAEYVVIRDLRWEMEFAPIRPEDVGLYRQQYENLEDDEEDPGIHFPAWTNLGAWLDGEYVDATEVGDLLADHWSSISEVLRIPVSQTLMRVPIHTPIDSIADMLDTAGDTQTRWRSMLAPLGYMRYKEMDDPWADLDTNWDPRTDMIGCMKNGPSQDFYHRMYRSWEPYDQLKGVIMRRQAKAPKLWMPATKLVQQHYVIPFDEVEAVEPVGFPQHPTTLHARGFKLWGSFPGDIVVSARRRNPLLLNFQSCPIRLRVDNAVGGGATIIYARAFLQPVRWHVSANIRVR